MVEIILSTKDREIEIAVTKDSTLLEKKNCNPRAAKLNLGSYLGNTKM